MKKILFLVCAVLIVLPAYAGQITLSWQPSTGATGYRIYESQDYGNTWLLVEDLSAQPLPTSTSIDTPEGQLVLYRVSAYNTKGEVIQYIQGAWYDSALLPGTPAALPSLATQGLGAQ